MIFSCVVDRRGSILTFLVQLRPLRTARDFYVILAQEATIGGAPTYARTPLFSAESMRNKLDDSPSKPSLAARPRWRRAVPCVAAFLSVGWTGYFLYAAFRLYGRWQFMREYFGPFYPRDLEPTVHAIMERLDWRIPLGMAGLPLVALIVWRVSRFVTTRVCPVTDEASFRKFAKYPPTTRNSTMQTFQASSTAPSNPRWLISPWLVVLISALLSATALKFRLSGWSDPWLALAEQLRMASAVICLLLAVASHRRCWQSVLLAFAAGVVFVTPLRSIGYYPELVLLITLALALSGRRMGAVLFLFTASILLAWLLYSVSPYRVDRLANMTLDWWDASREQHEYYALLQQNVRLGGLFGFSEYAMRAATLDPYGEYDMQFGWSLSLHCLRYGSLMLIAWIAASTFNYWWITRRTMHVANEQLRLLLFVLAILTLALALQPAIEVNGLLPKWLGSHPIAATLLSQALLALSVMRMRRSESPAGWPRSWLLIHRAMIGLAALTVVKTMLLLVV